MSAHDGRRLSPVDLDGADWRRSSRSSGNGACVEVAAVAGLVAVRDSKIAQGPVLVFTPHEWQAFLGSGVPLGASGCP
ncbi:DUF397 domain-containing protein [Streptomyces sp. NPDC093982]|uniref:DUF397 domain-containing protein n=1 Tax=Streptomyces sp. NPDC093982 TaxID=3155077 RepID=UPI0034154DE4